MHQRNPMRRLVLSRRLAIQTFAAVCALCVTDSSHSQKSASFFPAKEGNTWRMKGSVGNLTSVTVWNIMDIVPVEEGGSEVTIQVTSNDSIILTYIWHVDAEGISIVGSGTDGNDRVNPPMPLLKYPVKTGQKWFWKGTMTTEGEDIDATMTSSVTGPETFKTPAKTFKAYRVHSVNKFTIQGHEFIVPTDTWFAPGVGIVATKLHVGNLSINMKLTSYKLK